MTSQNITALMVGATGFVGNLLLRRLLADQNFGEITVYGRRQLSVSHSKLTVRTIDFDTLSHRTDFEPADLAFCCLGTTMKKAGSKEAFHKVDFEYVVNFAHECSRAGVKHFFLISAMGADASSMFYYNEVKGQAEEAIEKLNFESIHFVRPSLLLGDREEFRLGEKVGQFFNKVFKPLIPLSYQGVQGEQLAVFMHQKGTEAVSKNQKGTLIHSSADIQKQVPNE